MQDTPRCTHLQILSPALVGVSEFSTFTGFLAQGVIYCEFPQSWIVHLSRAAGNTHTRATSAESVSLRSVEDARFFVCFVWLCEGLFEQCSTDVQVTRDSHLAGRRWFEIHHLLHLHDSEVSTPTVSLHKSDRRLFTLFSLAGTSRRREQH